MSKSNSTQSHNIEFVPVDPPVISGHASSDELIVVEAVMWKGLRIMSIVTEKPGSAERHHGQVYLYADLPLMGFVCIRRPIIELARAAAIDYITRWAAFAREMAFRPPVRPAASTAATQEPFQ